MVAEPEPQSDGEGAAGADEWEPPPHEEQPTIRVVVTRRRRVVWVEPLLHGGARVRLIPVASAIRTIVLARICAVFGHEVEERAVLEASPVGPAVGDQQPGPHEIVLVPVDGPATVYAIEEHLGWLCSVCDGSVCDGEAPRRLADS